MFRPDQWVRPKRGKYKGKKGVIMYRAERARCSSKERWAIRLCWAGRHVTLLINEDGIEGE